MPQNVRRYTRLRNPKPPYTSWPYPPWIGGWSDNRESIAYLVSELKSAGVRAKSSYSPYVGHRELVIHGDDVEKAVEVLRRESQLYIAQVFAEQI